MIVGGPGNPASSGLGFKVSNPNNLAKNQQAIADSLREAGLDFNIQQQNAALPHLAADACLLVTTKIL
jgi:hypothetical protein